MNFKKQVVTAAHRAAFVVKGLEEVIAHSYNSEECSKCLHEPMFFRRYCSHVACEIKSVDFGQYQIRPGLQNISLPEQNILRQL